LNVAQRKQLMLQGWNTAQHIHSPIWDFKTNLS